MIADRQTEQIDGIKNGECEIDSEFRDIEIIGHTKSLENRS